MTQQRFAIAFIFAAMYVYGIVFMNAQLTAVTLTEDAAKRQQ